MTGRVASLLDVGTGFHPELTGRENTYLNGAILGMTRVEITRKFDEIVAFAGVEQFIDTPVKRYSTGMHARLAFAVAAHLDSDILMVDELLAVGDVEFQKRCLGKIESVAHGGRTVLLVSHQLAALCTHALWLDRGRMLFAGCPDEAIALYLASGSTARAERRWEPGPDAPFGADVRLLAARVLDPAGRASSVIDIRNPLVVEIEYELPRKLDYCMIGFTVMTSTGIEVFTSYDSQDGSVGGNPRLAGRYRSRCQIPGGLLNQGDYSISISTDLAFTERVLVEPDILRVSVEQTGGGGAGVSELRWPGVICPKLPWEVVSL
jgi:lipopolysaccharide transport system ATP-binding protein